MEITRHNFSDSIEDIEKQLRACCLVGFDAEFTSLPSHDAIKPRLFDDGAARYNRMRAAVSNAMMTQVGLTLFIYERDSSIYRAYTYTFHLRPQAVGDINQTFRFQASTLEFLCRHGFDFNKFIYEGIPFLSRTDVAYLRSLQKSGELVDTLMRGLEIVQEQELQTGCSAVSKWLTSGNDDSTSDTLYLEPSTPVMRYLLHYEIRNRFTQVLTTDSLGATDTVLVYRSREVAGAVSKPERELAERLLQELLGFSRVVELLAECGKPLVGHNMFLDLILMHNQFLSPLPHSYSEFKRNVHAFVPQVYDTKHIAAALARKLSFDEVWKSTALQELYEFMSEDKCKRLRMSGMVVVPAREFERHQTYHEAGWDSYCAGYLLVRLGGWAASEVSGRGGAGPSQILAALRTQCNKTNLMRCAVQYMNLEGEDPPRHRPQLMHVRSLRTRKINVAHVAALLSWYGTVDVQPYGARSALVAPATHHTAEKILKGFKNPDYRISVYSVYRHSPAARVAIWSGAIVTGGVVLMFLHNKMQS